MNRRNFFGKILAVTATLPFLKHINPSLPQTVELPPVSGVLPNPTTTAYIRWKHYSAPITISEYELENFNSLMTKKMEERGKIRAENHNKILFELFSG